MPIHVFPLRFLIVGVAGDRADGEFAGGDDVRVAGSLLDVDVSGARAHPEPGRAIEPKVADAGLDVDVAEAAVAAEVGDAGVGAQRRSFGQFDGHLDGAAPLPADDGSGDATRFALLDEQGSVRQLDDRLRRGVDIVGAVRVPGVHGDDGVGALGGDDVYCAVAQFDFQCDGMVGVEGLHGRS